MHEAYRAASQAEGGRGVPQLVTALISQAATSGPAKTRVAVIPTATGIQTACFIAHSP